MTAPSVFLWLMLCSTSGKIQAFTSPMHEFWFQTYQSSAKGEISLSMAKGLNKNDEPEIIVKRRQPASEERSKGTRWESFKGAIYGSFDVIENSLVPPNEDTSSELGNRRAPLAYSNTVGKTTDPPTLLSNFISEDPETPGEKLLRQYQSTNNISAKSNNDNESVDFVSIEEDDLYRSDFRKKFDSAKDGIYNSFDFISRSTSSIANKNKSPDLLLSDSNRIRPMAKTSINKDKGLSDRKLQQREKKIRRKETIEGTKETLYNVIDGIQTVGEVVVAIPEKVGQTVEVTQDVLVGTSVKVKDTIEGVQAFPGKVKNLVGDVRDSVEETKRITSEVSQDIKNIPKTVEDKISDTQKSIREKKEGVLDAVKKGEEVVYSAKVLAGMAKPKPKPPPPPKPKTATDIALKLTGSFVWFVAKGTTNNVISGTKMAWSAFGPSSKEAAIAKESNDDVGVIEKSVEEMNTLKPILTIQPIDDLLVVDEAVDEANTRDSQLNDDAGVIRKTSAYSNTLDTKLVDVVPAIDEAEEESSTLEPQPNDDVGVIEEAVVEIDTIEPKPVVQSNDDALVINEATEDINALESEPVAQSNDNTATIGRDAAEINVLEPNVIDRAEEEIKTTEPKLESEPVYDDESVVNDAVIEIETLDPKEGLQVDDDVVSEARQEMNAMKPEPTFFIKKPKSVSPTVEPVISEGAKIAQKPTLAQLDPSLDKEITEALRAAEEALASLEKEDEENAGVTYAEIDKALRKAKLAAAKATKDAAELNVLLRKTRIK